MRSARPWRQVIAFDKYAPKFAPRGGTRVILSLSCGHSLRRKGSEVPGIESRQTPMWVRCPECHEEAR